MSKSLLTEADILFENHEYEKVFKLLTPYKDEENDEILWRLAQSMHDIAYYSPQPNSEKSKRLYAESLRLTENALKINDKNPEVHKMMAAALDAHYKNISIRARVEQSVNIRKHVTIASELNPTDPHPWYMLGQWYYTIADLPWAVKKLTKIVFSTTLEASFEQAYDYFQKELAIEGVETYKNYITGNLMTAKCCLKLNKRAEAAEYLKKVFELPDHTPIEKLAHDEAKKLRKDLYI